MRGTGQRSSVLIRKLLRKHHPAQAVHPEVVQKFPLLVLAFIVDNVDSFAGRGTCDSGNPGAASGDARDAGGRLARRSQDLLNEIRGAAPAWGRNARLRSGLDRLLAGVLLKRIVRLSGSLRRCERIVRTRRLARSRGLTRVLRLSRILRLHGLSRILRLAGINWLLSGQLLLIRIGGRRLAGNQCLACDARLPGELLELLRVLGLLTGKRRRNRLPSDRVDDLLTRILELAGILNCLSRLRLLSGIGRLAGLRWILRLARISRLARHGLAALNRILRRLLRILRRLLVLGCLVLIFRNRWHGSRRHDAVAGPSNRHVEGVRRVDGLAIRSAARLIGTR